MRQIRYTLLVIAALLVLGWSTVQLVHVADLASNNVEAVDLPDQALVYWVAECETAHLDELMVPGTVIGPITIRTVQISGNKISALIEHTGEKPAGIIAHFLGTTDATYTMLSIRGPSGIQAMMGGYPKCKNVMSYTSVLTVMPEPSKAWLIDKSTCFGEAGLTNASGIHYLQEWPCTWVTTRQTGGESFTATAIDAVGPGITCGGSAAEAAGWNPPTPDGGI
jgi:hypothetical protein